MTDDRGDDDAPDDSDWLASQFDEIGNEPPPPPLVVPPPSAPVETSSFAPPPPAGAPSNLLFPAGPPPVATPAQGGGFTWGLKPSAPELPPVEAVPPVDAVPSVDAVPPVEAAAPPELPPTVAMDEVDDQQTQAFVVPPWTPTPPPTPPPAAPPVPPAQPLRAWENLPPVETEPWDDDDSAIDSLFGDTRFQSYEEVGVLQTITTAPGAADGAGVARQPREPRAPLTGLQKTLLWIAVGLVAAIVLIALFFFGTRIGEQRADAAASPKPHPTATATPTPTPTAGPAAIGVQPWNALRGGECINPFSTEWALDFTVVDCSTPHAGQMIYRGTLAKGSAASYPSDAKVASEITPVCTAATTLNYAAAAAYSDVQLSFSYPPDRSSWQKGDRTYYCFVARSSGDPITGDLSLPQSTATPAPTS